jgi:hypothetical protein
MTAFVDHTKEMTFGLHPQDWGAATVRRGVDSLAGTNTPLMSSSAPTSFRPGETVHRVFLCIPLVVTGSLRRRNPARKRRGRI